MKIISIKKYKVVKNVDGIQYQIKPIKGETFKNVLNTLRFKIFAYHTSKSV